MKQFFIKDASPFDVNEDFEAIFGEFGTKKDDTVIFVNN